MDTDFLMGSLRESEAAMSVHLNEAKKSLIAYRARKFLRHPYRYLRLGSYKLGLSPETARAHTFFGGGMYVPLSDVNARDLYYAGSLRISEGYVTRFLLKNLRPGITFYDIGANYGYYSMLALALGGTVHAFEPSPHCLGFLHKSFAQFSNEKYVLNPVVLSDTRGKVDFYDASVGHKSGMSTIDGAVAAASAMSFRKSSADAITLDTYAVTHPVPELIKLDTEGSEARVLSGGRKLLEEHAPLIVMELWDKSEGNSRQALELLTALGYQAHRIQKDGSITPVEIKFGSIEDDNNFVFKKGTATPSVRT